MEKRRYGLFTAITMITGIVIGSGIFFKADDVLKYTNGNVLLGVIVFVVAAIAIVFGCLAISSLATLTDKPGGLIAYMEEFVGIGPSCSLGWFQTFLYYPTLCAVLSWVSGIYICMLFDINNTLDTQIMIGFFCLVIFFIFNTLSAKLGGYFQNGAMIIKLVPLVLVALAGLFFGNTGAMTAESVKNFGQATSSLGWIAAFAPIAFSFDGWIVSTSISNEIKNSKRNLPLALTISPLIILIAYVAYFVGITSLLGPEKVLNIGDNSVYEASTILFGQIGAKLVLTFVVISVLGTLNGLTLGFIRMPYSLALRNMIPGSNTFKKNKDTLDGMPINSAIFAFILSVIWLGIHYLTQKKEMAGDVSEIAIGVSYLGYIVLYITVMRLAKQGKIKSKIKGYVIPILASIGSLIIISGSVTHPLFIYYLTVCVIIIIAGFLYYIKSNSTETKKYKILYLCINITMIYFIIVIAPLMILTKVGEIFSIGIISLIIFGLWSIFNGIWNACTDYYSFFKTEKVHKINNLPKLAWWFVVIVGVLSIFISFIVLYFFNHYFSFLINRFLSIV